MLRLVYRSYGGENWKNRPAWYSKRLVLVSFVRAVRQAQSEGVDVEAVFVNDGPVSVEQLDLMRPVGTVTELPRVGMRRSYTFGLHLPQRMGWAADDVVWFSEDDYLYCPDAFVQLMRGAEAMPDVSYFGLYGTPHGERPTAQRSRTPRGWADDPHRVVEGRRWSRLLSIASTFGGRAGVIGEDLPVFRFCMVPHRTMYRDHDTCVVLQGYEPHSYLEQFRALALRGEGSFKERVRDAGVAPFLLATNVRSHRRPTNRRIFMTTVPNLAAHAEDGQLPAGVDWAVLASDVEAWDSSRAAEPTGGVLGVGPGPLDEVAADGSR